MADCMVELTTAIPTNLLKDNIMAHGKGARVRAREKRARRKAEKMAEFASKIGHPSNKKKKGDQAGGKNWSTAKITITINGVELKAHGGPECGNIGCKRCNA